MGVGVAVGVDVGVQLHLPGIQFFSDSYSYAYAYTHADRRPFANNFTHVGNKSRLILPTLEINRVHQAQRFFIRQNALFHLIHHIGERDFVFGIGESVTAAGAGMTE